MKQLGWSSWHLLNKSKFRIVPENAGIYQIRWAVNGKPQPISRANGIDKRGLLYIGSTKNLRRRIRNLWHSIRSGKRGHTVGRTYVTYNYCRKFKLDQLEVRWATLAENEAQTTESRLLGEYVTKYLDKPPLNISVKRPKAHFTLIGAYSNRQ